MRWLARYALLVAVAHAQTASAAGPSAVAVADRAAHRAARPCVISPKSATAAPMPRRTCMYRQRSRRSLPRRRPKRRPRREPTITSADARRRRDRVRAGQKELRPAADDQRLFLARPARLCLGACACLSAWFTQRQRRDSASGRQAAVWRAGRAAGARAVAFRWE